jgi:hypothetical protein
VKVGRLDSFTLEQWVAEFVKLKKLDEEMLPGKKGVVVRGRKNDSATVILQYL